MLDRAVNIVGENRGTTDVEALKHPIPLQTGAGRGPRFMDELNALEHQSGCAEEFVNGGRTDNGAYKHRRLENRILRKRTRE